MSERKILVEKRDHFAILTISNPDMRNALHPEMLEQLAERLEESAREDIRAIILRGEGEKYFSFGFDVTALPIGRPEEEQHYFYKDNPLRRACDAVINYPYPVIAMVNGMAFGGAVELLASCDLRFAREGIHLGMPPAKLGLIYDPWGLIKFVQMIGPARTRELFYTAEPINAARALEFGLLNRVVPAAELADTCYKIAAGIAANSPLSIKGHKFIFNRLGWRLDLPQEELVQIFTLMRQAFESEDLREGVQALLARRPPNFQGK